jgi:GNAT superfamily N-acetyltransferase
MIRNMDLRPMRASDVDGLSAAILADDWGDRHSWLAFVTGHPACRAMVAADADDTAFATAVVTLNGPVGWIGTVWVAPDHRRSGVGRDLTAAVIDEADAAGCRTLVLVATDAGRPLYEGLGFEVQTWYVTVEAEGLPMGPADPRIRPFRTGDLPAMLALDAAATGEDRRHLLAAFASPTSTRVLEAPGGKLDAFIVRAPWGGGATIAPTAADARSILEARRQVAGPARRVRAGVLLENAAGLARLRDDGWREAWRAPRLVRGAPLDWRPTAIWGQFNHALG